MKKNEKDQQPLEHHHAQFDYNNLAVDLFRFILSGVH